MTLDERNLLARENFLPLYGGETANEEEVRNRHLSCYRFARRLCCSISAGQCVRSQESLHPSQSSYASGYADGACQQQGYSGGSVTSCNSDGSGFTFSYSCH